jgi:hypothetical protein
MYGGFRYLYSGLYIYVEFFFVCDFHLMNGGAMLRGVQFLARIFPLHSYDILASLSNIFSFCGFFPEDRP